VVPDPKLFVLVGSHRLNMEVDLQSLFGLHVTWCAQLHSLAETPQLPPSPRIWTRITRALLVRKDRRHLFVTPVGSGTRIFFPHPTRSEMGPPPAPLPQAGVFHPRNQMGRGHTRLRMREWGVPIRMTGEMPSTLCTLWGQAFLT
jgi:hypothetical protein